MGKRNFNSKGVLRIHRSEFLRPELMKGNMDETYILLRLKNAGAPIRGTVYLRRDEDYDWTFEHDLETDEIVYKWEKL